MIRVATIALAMLMTADAGAWTVKYTEHCIAAVNRVVRPPDKFKLLSEIFGSDFGLVHVWRTRMACHPPALVHEVRFDVGVVCRRIETAAQRPQ